MGKADGKWVSVGIPRRFVDRIKRILGFVADESLAEYVRQAVQVRLRHDEAEAEEEKMLREEIGARLQR